MKITWTETAKITFEAEQEFIFKKWNAKEVLKFIDLINLTILKLSNFPELGIKVKNKRHLVISKQTTLIYKILSDEHIEILLFWNNKWNPKDFENILI